MQLSLNLKWYSAVLYKNQLSQLVNLIEFLSVYVPNKFHIDDFLKFV